MLVSEDGALHIEGMVPGEKVEVIVLQLSPLHGTEPLRRGGWAKGKVVVHDDFDDPLPEMEAYF